MRSIALVIGEAFGRHGGIERFNRTMCFALSEYAISHGLNLSIISRNDSACVDRRYVPEHAQIAFKGCRGNISLFIYEITRCISTERPSILILNHVNFAPLGLFFRTVRLLSKYWVTIYGIEAWNRLSLLRRLGLRRANLVLSISEYTRQACAQHNGVNPSRIKILQPTLDPFWGSIGEKQINIPADRDFSQNHLKILSVSRLTKFDRYKNIDMVLSVLLPLIARVGDISYTIVGDGDDRPRLEELSKSLGLEERVFFCGSVESSLLERLYSECDVFVLPSKKEGFGIVFIEAMSHAKPVIGFRHGGPTEIIIDGETGYLVSSGEELLDRLSELAVDADLRRKMGNRALQHIQKRFTYATFRANLFQLLDNILYES